MSNIGLSGIQLAAALGGQIYTRNSNGIALQLSDLGATGVDLDPFSAVLRPSGARNTRRRHRRRFQDFQEHNIAAK